MDDVGTLSYWVRFGLVVLVAVVSIIYAVRRTRSRVPRSDLVVGAVGLALLFGVALFVGLPIDAAIIGVLVVVGLALGWFAGGVRALIAWVTALAFVFAAVMLLFGLADAAALGASVLASGFAAPLGQGVRGLVGAGRETSDAPAAVAKPHA